MKKIIFIFIVLFNSNIFAQEKTGFAVDLDANNIAALFTMTNEEGRIRNLELMENVFKDGSLGFKSQRHHNVSSTYIYNKLTEIASNLDNNSTLLLYFNSHGGGSGNNFAMTSKEGSFKFSKALEYLKKSNKKIRRLLIFVDTCHAQGSIQDSLKENGELLRNIQKSKPSKELKEMPDQNAKQVPPTAQVSKSNSFYTSNDLPFLSIFLEANKVNYGQDSGIYDEILIISSCSVEDLSIRGVFAIRLSKTFENIKGNKEIKVKDFLKMFADSHPPNGQQPYYKALPNNLILEEYLFGPVFAQKIPIIDLNGNVQKFNLDYIPIPRIMD